ncbi:hypothetical protein GA0061099_101728 [Bradyrhizobium yuanmingense]|uniref:Uncharacterized protein n=1 Tax=Bradyrhizobium yuanmingense TaxID=108015 RepID=A0A1C3XGE8_9BRAD|nr:hypothetical protein IQ15_07084 [Bradyrhizobium yuanmingense]SCB51352.1 hypothetical protein GA0061099_101728 [Bradyrhizobium yuanmingense]
MRTEPHSRGSSSLFTFGVGVCFRFIDIFSPLLLFLLSFTLFIFVPLIFVSFFLR